MTSTSLICGPYFIILFELAEGRLKMGIWPPGRSLDTPDVKDDTVCFLEGSLGKMCLAI